MPKTLACALTLVACDGAPESMYPHYLDASYVLLQSPCLTPGFILLRFYLSASVFVKATFSEKRVSEIFLAKNFLRSISLVNTQSAKILCEISP